MPFFGFHIFSQYLLAAFAAAIVLTILAGCIKLYLTRLRLRGAVEAATQRSLRGSSASSEGTTVRGPRRVFGIRALEAGIYGGIVQARNVPRQSSTMRQYRLSTASSSQYPSHETTHLVRELLEPRTITIEWPGNAGIDIGDFSFTNVQPEAAPNTPDSTSPLRRRLISMGLQRRNSSTSPRRLKSRISPLRVDKPYNAFFKASKRQSLPLLSSVSPRLKAPRRQRSMSLPAPLNISDYLRLRKRPRSSDPRTWHHMAPARHLYGGDGNLDLLESIRVETPPPPARQRRSYTATRKATTETYQMHVRTRSSPPQLDGFSSGFEGYTIPTATTNPGKTGRLSFLLSMKREESHSFWGSRHPYVDPTSQGSPAMQRKRPRPPLAFRAV